MNWKNQKGYKITGTLNFNETERYAIFVLKTKKGMAWVTPSYLDSWNSGHAGHVLDGEIISESEFGFVFKATQEGTELNIEEMVTDEVEQEFAVHLKEKDYDYKGQYDRMKKGYDR